MKNVTDDGARGRGDNADDPGEERKPALVLGREEPFRGERLAALFEECEQGALARDFHLLDDDLVLRAPRVSGELAGRDDLSAVFGKKSEGAGIAAPDHRIDARVLILQREIAMAGPMALEPADLAANPDVPEGALDGPLECARELGDGKRR